MKFHHFFIFFYLIISTELLASPLVPIPRNCFQENLLCSSYQVVEKVIEGIKEKVINIDIFALISKEDFSDPSQIIKRFYDFNSWKEAIINTGTNKIKIKKSLTLEPLVTASGEIIHRQYINYAVKGPSPLFYVPARAVGHYWQIPAEKEALFSGEFIHLNEGVFEIPGEEILTGSIGYRYHSGSYHITEDIQNYYLHFRAFMIPDIDYLYEALAVFIADGYVEIIKGLYYL